MAKRRQNSGEQNQLTTAAPKRPIHTTNKRTKTLRECLFHESQETRERRAKKRAQARIYKTPADPKGQQKGRETASSRKDPFIPDQKQKRRQQAIQNVCCFRARAKHRNLSLSLSFF